MARLIPRIAGILAFAWFLYDAVRPGWTRPSSDFPNYYTAATLVRTHQPLRRYYDWPWFQRQMHFAGIDHQLGGYIPQTPLTMMPFVPLSFLSPQNARRIWLLLNLFFLGASLWLLARMTGFGFAELWLLAFLGYPALRANIVLGQYYLFLLAIITLAAFCLLRKRDFATGVLLGAAFALKLYGGALFLLFAVRRRWRAAIGMSALSVALVCCAVAVFGWRDISYFATQVLPRALAGETLDPYHPSNGTAATLLRRLFVFEAELNPRPLVDSPRAYAFCRTLFTLSVIAFPAIAAARQDGPISKRLLAWWFIATLLASPNTASYTFALLILPVALLFDELSRRCRVPLGAAYVLLALPLWPAWSWLFPKFWLLLILFLAVGYRDLRLIPARQAAVAFGAIVAVSAAAAFGEQSGTYFEHAVTHPGAVYSDFPVMSRDGLFYESIGQRAYVVRRNSETFALEGEAGEAFHPAAPDSGSPIYFEAVEYRNSRIVRMFDARRSETVPIGVPNPTEPAVSHDGTKLAVVSADRLYVFDGHSTRGLETPGPVRDPSFAPGDGSVVFAAEQEIGSVELESGRIRILVREPTEFTRPSLSHDGAHLLFAARRGATWQVWVRDLANGHERKLTDGNCNAFSPAWSLTSNEIVFASDCRRGLGLPALFRVTLFQ